MSVMGGRGRRSCSCCGSEDGQLVSFLPSSAAPGKHVHTQIKQITVAEDDSVELNYKGTFPKLISRDADTDKRTPNLNNRKKHAHLFYKHKYTYTQKLVLIN